MKISVRCALSALSSDCERDLAAGEEHNLRDFPHSHHWRAITQSCPAIAQGLLGHYAICSPQDLQSKYITHMYKLAIDVLCILCVSKV